MPTAYQEVPYVTMEELEQVYIASQRKRKTEQSTETSGQSWKDATKQAPSQQELNGLYRNLSQATGRKPAFLSLQTGYSHVFTQSSDHLPSFLQGLYKSENLHLDSV